MKSKSKSKTKSKKVATALTCRAANATAVSVAGTFNGWSTTALPMQQVKPDQWLAEISLAPGNYEYKFVVDGEWGCEPGCEHAYAGCPKCVPNAYGTMNRTLEVK